MRHALPGVGENLRDHYAPRFVARVKNAETINEKSHGLKLVGEVLKYAIARKGILSLNPTLVYVFWKSDERVDNYDLQLTFTPASYKEGVQSTARRFPRHDHRLLAAAARQHAAMSARAPPIRSSIPSSSPTTSSPRATGRCCWPA